MIRSSPGITAFLRAAVVRPPADTLELELCGAVLPAPEALDPWSRFNGGDLRGVRVLSLRQLVFAQYPPMPFDRVPGAMVFATDEAGQFWLDGADAMQTGKGAVYRQTDAGLQRVAPSVDAFLEHLATVEGPWRDDHRPEQPAQKGRRPRAHGARIGERLVMALTWLPWAAPHIRYAVRRAASLDSAARMTVLEHLFCALTDELHGAYAHHVVTDALMDRVIERLVDPFVDRARAGRWLRSMPGSRGRADELREVMLVGSLSDLGEHFRNVVQTALVGFITEYTALLSLSAKLEPIDPIELGVRLRRLDDFLDDLGADPDRLIDTLPRTPHRDRAARGLLAPLGYEWMLDTAAE